MVVCVISSGVRERERRLRLRLGDRSSFVSCCVVVMPVFGALTVLRNCRGGWAASMKVFLVCMLNAVGCCWSSRLGAPPCSRRQRVSMVLCVMGYSLSWWVSCNGRPPSSRRCCCGGIPSVLKMWFLMWAMVCVCVECVGWRVSLWVTGRGAGAALGAGTTSRRVRALGCRGWRAEWGARTALGVAQLGMVGVTSKVALGAGGTWRSAFAVAAGGHGHRIWW